MKSIQANGEEAHLAALNKEEQQDLDITKEMEEHEREWEEDEDISDFQRTRPPVDMMKGSRRVDACFERLNRISEGTYGVVHRWAYPSCSTPPSTLINESKPRRAAKMDFEGHSTFSML